jgi:hypothetical protein
LATGLDYLSVDENWQSFEAELNGAIMHTYDTVRYAKAYLEFAGALNENILQIGPGNPKN